MIPVHICCDVMYSANAHVLRWAPTAALWSTPFPQVQHLRLVQIQHDPRRLRTGHLLPALDFTRVPRSREYVWLPSWCTPAWLSSSCSTPPQHPDSTILIATVPHTRISCLPKLQDLTQSAHSLLKPTRAAWQRVACVHQQLRTLLSQPANACTTWPSSANRRRPRS